MVQQRRTFFPSLQGLLLVAVASAWIGGIFLCSLLPNPLPTPLLLIAAVIMLLTLLLPRPATQSRIVLLLIACMLLGAWRYAIVLPSNDPQALTNFMKGPPDTPTTHLGVRWPQRATSKDENKCYTGVYGCAAQQTRHLQAGLPLCLVSQIPQKMLVGKLATFVAQEIRRICAENTWTIGAVNIQPDHVHLFLSAPPSVAPSEIAHTLNGTTARKVFQQLPEVKKHVWDGAFWPRSYCVGSAGDMSVETAVKEIE